MQRYLLTGQRPRLAIAQGLLAQPGKGEVVVEMRAASLNYRDLLIAKAAKDVVPLSDGSGVISALGEGVTGHAVGDRVVIGFMPGWTEGEYTQAKKVSSLGEPGVDGVLQEFVVVQADGDVRIPDWMTFEEAATLPCAAVTAWAALFERRPVQPGETVLLLGTGGVSIFALQLAKKAGARVIITSSSDEKLKRAKTLGADECINYHGYPNWEDRVLTLTGGIGADLAVDVAGPATLNQTALATRYGGRISLVGVLAGFDGPVSIGPLLERRITLQSLYVGPVSTLRAVVRAGIKPQVDRVYAFHEAEKAYEALEAAGHFGKLVVRIGG
ncbi:MAG: NAD(P)-dependent alcohol dehydrogenase [Comamonadaceae bacterium]|nr:MAG: NAD(P)-dependent alcohol dehydrogenase [Comamonadaceae bacterium]